MTYLKSEEADEDDDNTSPRSAHIHMMLTSLEKQMSYFRMP